MSERAPGRPQPTRLTDRDREILAFAAEHRFVLAAHVQALLGASATFAYRRLAGLVEKGLLTRERIVHDQASWYRVTASGLKLIESDLPAPRLDLRCYRHDTGLAWVWLAASRGAFGRVERLVCEREMRSHDGVANSDADKFGVQLGRVGPRGRLGLHYPDLLLVGPGGERVAVELELSRKGGRRLEGILAAYAAEPRISAVLYLVDRPAIGREVESAAARLGISHLVHVRPVAWEKAAPAREAAAAARARGAGGRARGAGGRARGDAERASAATRRAAPNPRVRVPGRQRDEALER